MLLPSGREIQARPFYFSSVGEQTLRTCWPPDYLQALGGNEDDNSIMVNGCLLETQVGGTSNFAYTLGPNRSTANGFGCFFGMARSSATACKCGLSRILQATRAPTDSAMSGIKFEVLIGYTMTSTAEASPLPVGSSQLTAG